MNIRSFSSCADTLSLFQGDLLMLEHEFITSNMGASTLWRQKIRQHIEEKFHPYHPTEAHQFLSYEEYRAVCYLLTHEFYISYQDDIKQWMLDLGFNIDELYWDKIILRIVPPKGHYQHIAWHEHVPAHRDTWGVNLYSQINWWSPVYQIEENRSIQFFPDYWDRGVKNTTDSWSYAQYKQEKERTPINQKPLYPSMPNSLEEVMGAKAIVPNVDAWLLFSAAHLHSSVPNSSNLARFNIEFRTLDLAHVRAGKKAKNIDNQAIKKMPGLFSHLSHGERLTLDKLSV